MNWRLIRVFASVILILVVGFLVYAIWAPWPKITIRERLSAFPVDHLPLALPATIYWNEHQIPFIEAKTDDDAAFLLGMVQAHLRLGQMEMIRRIAYGRLSESIGPWGVEFDYVIRALDFPKHASDMEALLPQETKIWLIKYVEGINHYVENVKKLPKEFSYFALNCDEAWTVRDILAISRLMSSDFNWISVVTYLRLEGKKGFTDYWKDFQGFKDTVESPISMLQNFTKSGSNSFALSPKRTTQGRAILAGDPHLGISLPNLWMIIGMKSPSYHVVGLTIPCVPLVVIGRNNDIAWGGTNMHAWSTNLVNVSNEDSLTWTHRKEKLKVRFWKDQEVTLRETRWGPIVTDIPLLKNTSINHPLALKWMGFEMSDEMTALLHVNKARSWQEFQRAFDTYSVVGIFYTYADRQGNIGLLPAAKIPKRQDHDHLVIDSGETSKQSWQDARRLNRLLSIQNPNDGLIVSSNNRPSKSHWYTSPYFAEPIRHDRIRDLLLEKKKWARSDLISVQKDTYEKDAVVFSEIILSKIKSRNLVSSWTSELKKWDKQFEVNSKGALVFSLLVYRLALEIYKDKVDEKILEVMLASPDLVDHLTTVLETHAQQINFQAIILDVERDFKKFKNFGDYHRLRLTHPLSEVPLFGHRFIFSNLPWPGALQTPMKAKYAFSNRRRKVVFGAQSRYIFDFVGSDENYFMMLGGQDGWFGSDNFDDLTSLWVKDDWAKVPLHLNKVEEMFPYKMELH